MPTRTYLSTLLTTFTLASMVFATACAQEDELEFDPDKQDGYSFERTVAPIPVQLDSDPHTGILDSESYIAYEFSLPNPAILSIASSYMHDPGDGLYKNNDWVGAWNAINNSLNQAIFVHNGAEGDAGWDLVKRDDSSNSTPSLDSGRYMVIVLASPQAYEDMYPVYTEINQIADRPEIGAGTVTMQVIRTNQNNDVLGYAEGVRVALGTSSAITGEGGQATLTVNRGEYETKLGPEGLGRLDPSDPQAEIWVAGGGQEQLRIFSISEVDYLNWKTE